ncbi:MAG TPA: hypothetical protein VG942_02350, partial [Hyphomonadaceae bacterium]|nr:hypothetical protein [Hyphomonadaceae bacterium]
MTRNLFLTDLRGFANPAIAAHLAKAGARIVACDPAIKADGVDNGVDVIGWDTPAELVAKASSRFGGKLDGILISPAMPAPRTPIEDLTIEALMPYFQRIAAESLAFAGAAAKAMRPNKSGRIVFGTSSGHIGGIPGFAA